MHSDSPYEAARAGSNSVFPGGAQDFFSQRQVVVRHHHGDPWSVKRGDSATPLQCTRNSGMQCQFPRAYNPTPWPRRIYTDLGLSKVALLRVNDRYGRLGVLK